MEIYFILMLCEWKTSSYILDTKIVYENILSIFSLHMVMLLWHPSKIQ